MREAVVVDGLMFSNAESAGPDPKGILSQGYQTSVNTRGLIFIESDDPVVGLVCCIPVGITEISSITIGVRRGDRVAQGPGARLFQLWRLEHGAGVPARCDPAIHVGRTKRAVPRRSVTRSRSTPRSRSPTDATSGRAGHR